MTVEQVAGAHLSDIVGAMLDAIVLAIGVLAFAAVLIFIERRVLALWQDRHGPNRVGWGGSLQIVADVVKLIFKEDWMPRFVDRPTFLLAPAVAMGVFLLGYVIVPVTPGIGVADFSIGVLFFFALAGLAVYAVMLAGWSSNNKYALLGGLRSAALMFSYEVFMGIALMGVVIQSGSFNLRAIVDAQRHVWHVVPQFLGFCLFFVACVATTHRHPFDLPEAEQELAAGYHTEYSGLKFGMFMMAEYLGLVLVSALLVTLFFGGWHGPWLPPFAWFVIKTGCFIVLFVLMRAALPRPRYDQVMAVGWKVCLPLALANMLVTGAVVLARGGV